MPYSRFNRDTGLIDVVDVDPVTGQEQVFQSIAPAGVGALPAVGIAPPTMEPPKPSLDAPPETDDIGKRMANLQESADAYSQGEEQKAAAETARKAGRMPVSQAGSPISLQAPGEPVTGEPREPALPGEPEPAEPGAEDLTQPQAKQLGVPGVTQAEAATRQRADIQAKSLKDIADQQREALDTIADMQVERQEAEEAFWQSYKGKEDDLVKMRDEVFSQTIDPNRFFKELDTGQKILAAIGVALGGYLQGQTGRKNPAMEIINGAIQRDLQAQQTDISQGRKKFDAAENALARSIRTFKDENLGRLALELQQWDYVEKKIAEIANRAKSEDVKVAAEEAIGQARQKRAMIQAQFEQRNKATSWKDVKEFYAAKKAAREEREYQRGKQPIDPDTRVQDIPSTEREFFVPGMGIVGTKDDAKKGKALRAAADKTLSSIAALKRLAAEHGWEVWPTEAGKEAAQEAKLTLLRLKDQFNLGVLSKSDEDILNAIVADPSKVGTFNADAVIANLEKVVMREADAEFSAYGIEGAQPYTDYRSRKFGGKNVSSMQETTTAEPGSVFQNPNLTADWPKVESQ